MYNFSSFYNFLYLFSYTLYHGENIKKANYLHSLGQNKINLSGSQIITMAKRLLPLLQQKS